jgi:hypothetical protein
MFLKWDASSLTQRNLSIDSIVWYMIYNRKKERRKTKYKGAAGMQGYQDRKESIRHSSAPRSSVVNTRQTKTKTRLR